MSNIPAVNPNEVHGKTGELLEAVKKMLGGTPNLFKVTAQAPAALESMVAQFGAAAHGELPGKIREAIALTVAEANGCDYCLSAHTLLAKGAGLSDGDIQQARDGQAADAKLAAILEFARKLVVQRGNIGEGSRASGLTALAKLRQAGVGDTETLEIISNVVLNIFTNYVNLVAETDIDFPVVRGRSR